uniref:DUF4345 domain-containing protein n=1 Tax=Algoriphagus sp. TaxID=1872435 RepID=UPI0025834157|nr:DUF4345 domain-containing protein [Algoriphagus sp.]
MKSKQILKKPTQGYVIFSLLIIAYVSLIALLSPRQIMEMMQINLENNDAISSVRGVYGGLGLAITSILIYLLFNHPDWAFRFLVMYWGGHTLSRIITIVADGELGNFGTYWLLIEGLFFISGMAIFCIKKILYKTEELIDILVSQCS